MRINKKLLSMMLVTTLSLALLSCKGEKQNTIINFSKGTYIQIADENPISEDDIECSYTDSVEQINDELKQVYDDLFTKAKSEGKTIAFDYKYLDVDGAYIYKIKFNDDAEHSIIYHNNFYKEYQQNEDCQICIIRVNGTEPPMYDTYNISENTFFKVTGTAYIFYGRLTE